MITILEPLKNFPDFYASTDGHILKDCYEPPLKYFTKEDGYSRVKLLNKEGKETVRFVHKLVASVFIKKPISLHDKYTLNHINWDRSDNRPENLEWKLVNNRNNVECSLRFLCNDNECLKCYQHSFASSDKVKYWSKVNKLTPREVFKASGKKYKFYCDCEHTFETTLSSINRGSWCLYCSNVPKKLCDIDSCQKCYDKSFASSDKAKYWCKDNLLSPRDVFKMTGKKYKFDCHECNHIFEVSLNNVKYGKWCYYCAHKKLCEDFSCDKCHQNSFASSEKSKYWSRENDTIPRKVFKSCKIKYKFDCPCGHAFLTNPESVTAGYWCPYCSVPAKVLCLDNNCIQCHKKSFASSEKVQYWSNKNIELPRNVLIASNINKYKFDCNCGHTFESALNNIKAGNWCPYCAHQKLCKDDKCTSCYQNSFASSEKVQYWSNENTVNPRYISKSTDKKYKFEWDCGHQSIEAPLGLRKSNNCRKCDSCPSCHLWLTKGKLCEYCKPKSQNKLYQKTKEMDVVKFLKDKLPDKDFIHNKSVSTECTGTHLFPDILFDCNSYNLIVEVDEHKHRGASYACDEKRMYDIIAKLGLPCIFIRYNPDDKKSDKLELLNRVNYYLDLVETVVDTKEWNEFGFKAEYLFY